MLITVNSEEDMLRLGRYLAAILREDDVVYLLGELGVGKTVLVRGLAHALGYEGRVTSPTFTIMNVYNSTPPIYHFDFYRLQSPDLADLGLEDYMESGGISLVEWPQVGRNVLPREALCLEIRLREDDYDGARQVQITARGEQYQEKLERLRQIVDFSDR
ncbi:MAG: tRNA (adenosine(37)-N6)-threonylcarbamoyltransferase complex ATPase subunit type 1 TsaE [Firmicutes bacterium HGW-Firmicutes-15]|nr:MAG: tRNA (adenosine(37)-N6)-threonylcarbamoyltransferase complex ATPase subunit type 1 TsaE [Firmicutes bacterium HGW-Firmicutes-15]